MNAQKKLDDAASVIQALTLARNKQRAELAKAAREIVELRLKLAAIEKLATDTAGTPNDILRKIAKLFEVEQ